MKLVRDKVPGIIRMRGGDPDVFTAAPGREFRQALWAKLAEELAEVADAGDLHEVRDELADVLEVVYTLAAEYGIPASELDSARAEKAQNRGTFSRRIIWRGNR